MKITLFSGTANPTLAGAVAAKLGLGLGSLLVDRFPDGELHVSLRESVRGLDVYLLQPASPPVAENLVELLLMADACRRSGAAHVTAVVPYLGYARQDRRVKDGEPIGARVVADAIASGGVQRLIVVDLHNPALEGFFGVPLEHLSAVSLLAEALRPMLPQRAVLVAPDLGAVRLAELYAVLLDLPAATVHKVRLSGEQVRA
ncbi:MAG: ribose-phosphate pyrophosphokinase, partial [Chloroflexi bacterium]|nr:ribose-phosphate pyrophosphokinase [Chloroflexota bacterium]